MRHRRWLLLSALACSAGAGTLGEMAPPRLGAESIARTTSQRSLYALHCAGCHGFTGAGAPQAGVPDMRQLGRFLALDGGRAYVIKVPGVMASGLDDQQIADVTNWVLATLAKASTPPDQAPYSADEVRRARAEPLADVVAARKLLAEQARTRGLPLD